MDIEEWYELGKNDFASDIGTVSLTVPRRICLLHIFIDTMQYDQIAWRMICCAFAQACDLPGVAVGFCSMKCTLTSSRGCEARKLLQFRDAGSYLMQCRWSRHQQQLFGVFCLTLPLFITGQGAWQNQAEDQVHELRADLQSTSQRHCGMLPLQQLLCCTNFSCLHCCGSLSVAAVCLGCWSPGCKTMDSNSKHAITTQIAQEDADELEKHKLASSNLWHVAAAYFQTQV